MGATAELITTLAATGIVLTHVLIVALALGFLVAQEDTMRTLRRVSTRTVLWAGFFISLAATLGSLYYSEVVGLPVCDLCWFQRIAIYPQVILFGVALWRNDIGVWVYSLPLALVGMVFALNHYMLQMTGIDALSTCGALAGDVSCASIYFMEYGYVTFSMFGLTTLTLIAGASLLARWPNRIERS